MITCSFARTDTQSVGHGMGHVVLLVDATEQMRLRTQRVDRNVLAAMASVVRGHAHRLLVVVRRCV
jgi:hypothetical protein